MLEPASHTSEPAPQFIPFCEEELRALEYRQRGLCGDWAEGNIYLKKTSRPGWYKNANNPPLKGIMDLMSLWHVRTIVIRKGIQTGGTQGAYIFLAHEAAYSSGNDNALVAMADEKSVKKHGVNRLRPLFECSPELAAIMSPNPDDTTTYTMRLLSGFRIDVGWATSEVSVASEAYRVMIVDEISKFSNVQNIGEIKGRATTYEDSKKQIFLSSPDEDGTDPLQAEEAACEVHFEFWPVCPECGEAQPMVWENFHWPTQPGLLPGDTAQDPHPGEIRRLQMARYACKHCGVLWDNHAKDRAVLLAMARQPYSGWVPDKDIHRFNSFSVVYPGWLSPYVSLSECVAKWIEAQNEIKETGRDDKLKKWTTTVAGEYFKREQLGTVTEAHLLRYKSDLPRNLVPPETYGLALMVDTQQSSFYYQVWSIGFAPACKLHMVRHGILSTFADIEGLLVSEDFRDHTGQIFRIMGGLIDSGGTRRGYQKHSRTVEVYEWCALHRTMMPIKGAHGRKGELLSYKEMATYPGTNKAIPGLLKRANVRVDLFKDELERRLAIEPDDPGALSFHCGTPDPLLPGEFFGGIDETFARHYTTEIKDDAGNWIHNRSKGRNDYFDCNNYVLAFLEMIKLQIPRPVQETEYETPAPAVNDTRHKNKSRRW